MLAGLCSSSPAYHEADADSLADLYVLVAIGLGAAVDELRAVLDEVLLDVEELCYLVGHYAYVCGIRAQCLSIRDVEVLRDVLPGELRQVMVRVEMLFAAMRFGSGT